MQLMENIHLFPLWRNTCQAARTSPWSGRREPANLWLCGSPSYELQDGYNFTPLVSLEPNVTLAKHI